ncbi:MAG: C40 family peptidase [Muribaculaceae bacterium]|nr:C40 family peptidase [Muribaculaceae bacterium]
MMKLLRHKIFLLVSILCCCMLIFSSCRTKAKIPYPGNHTVRQEVVGYTGKLHGDRKRIVEEACDWIGTPYKYAGAEKYVGADCSGMVLRVYESVTSIKLPRNSAKQSEFCKSLKRSEVKPGDLVFFATGKSPDRISHVGIMIDEDAFVHSSTKRGVVIASVSSPYFQKTFMGFGRVPGMK